jgi:hypothetical protein
MLRRRKRKESAVRRYSIAAVSLFILAFEIWYLDSLSARTTQPHRVVVSKEFVVAKHSPSFSFLTEDEGASAEPRRFLRKSGVLNHLTKSRFGQDSQRR